MSKPIPKFLHKELKELIGKNKTAFGDLEKLLELVITTKYEWTERVTQQVNVHYEADINFSLAEMVENLGDEDELQTAWSSGDMDEVIRIIEASIDLTADDVNDNRWDYGEEVDRDYLDEEFEDTIDSGYTSNVVVGNQPQTTFIGDQVREFQNSHEAQGPRFSWRNIVDWYSNRRRTPLNDRAHQRYLEDLERY